MEQKNYVSVAGFPLFFRYYAFIDTGDHLADSLFIRHRVRVWYGDEYAHSDSEYRIVFCRIRKRDEGRFLDALGELPNKMILFGHPDYGDFCQIVLEAGKNREKDGRTVPPADRQNSGVSADTARAV